MERVGRHIVGLLALIGSSIIGSGLGIAREPARDPLDALRTIQFAGADSAAEVREAIDALERESATNSLICVEIGRRIAVPVARWAPQLERASFGTESGFCVARIGDVFVALSSTGDEADFYRYLTKSDFAMHRQDIEAVLGRATAVSVAKLAKRAAVLGVTELLPSIARKVSKTWDADDPIIDYSGMEHGVRWSIAVARALLMLGAEEHLDLPEVRAALQRCLDIEAPRRPREGTSWAVEEATFREPILQRVRAALASTEPRDDRAPGAPRRRD